MERRRQKPSCVVREWRVLKGHEALAPVLRHHQGFRESYNSKLGMERY